MMVNTLKAHPAKEKRLFETSSETYWRAWGEFQDTGTDAARRHWQQSLLDLIYAYERVVQQPYSPKNRRRALTFPWQPLFEIKSALRDVLDGKDTDLFFVTPSDRYDSTMRFAKEVAVAYVAHAKDKESRRLWSNTQSVDRR